MQRNFYRPLSFVVFVSLFLPVSSVHAIRWWSLLNPIKWAEVLFYTEQPDVRKLKRVHEDQEQSRDAASLGAQSSRNQQDGSAVPSAEAQPGILETVLNKIFAPFEWLWYSQKPPDDAVSPVAVVSDEDNRDNNDDNNNGRNRNNSSTRDRNARNIDRRDASGSNTDDSSDDGRYRLRRRRRQKNSRLNNNHNNNNNGGNNGSRQGNTVLTPRLGLDNFPVVDGGNQNQKHHGAQNNNNNNNAIAQKNNIPQLNVSSEKADSFCELSSGIKNKTVTNIADVARFLISLYGNDARVSAVMADIEVLAAYNVNTQDQYYDLYQMLQEHTNATLQQLTHSAAQQQGEKPVVIPDNNKHNHKNKKVAQKKNTHQGYTSQALSNKPQLLRILSSDISRKHILNNRAGQKGVAQRLLWVYNDQDSVQKVIQDLEELRRSETQESLSYQNLYTYLQWHKNKTLGQLRDGVKTSSFAFDNGESLFDGMQNDVKENFLPYSNSNNNNGTNKNNNENNKKTSHDRSQKTSDKNKSLSGLNNFPVKDEKKAKKTLSQPISSNGQNSNSNNADGNNNNQNHHNAGNVQIMGNGASGAAQQSGQSVVVPGNNNGTNKNNNENNKQISHDQSQKTSDKNESLLGLNNFSVKDEKKAKKTLSQPISSNGQNSNSNNADGNNNNQNHHNAGNVQIMGNGASGAAQQGGQSVVVSGNNNNNNQNQHNNSGNNNDHTVSGLGQQQVLNSTSSGGGTSSFATGSRSLMGLGLNNGAPNSQSPLTSNAQSNTNNTSNESSKKELKEKKTKKVLTKKKTSNGKNNKNGAVSQNQQSNILTDNNHNNNIATQNQNNGDQGNIASSTLSQEKENVIRVLCAQLQAEAFPCDSKALHSMAQQLMGVYGKATVKDVQGDIAIIVSKYPNDPDWLSFYNTLYDSLEAFKSITLQQMSDQCSMQSNTNTNNTNHNNLSQSDSIPQQYTAYQPNSTVSNDVGAVGVPSVRVLRAMNKQIKDGIESNESALGIIIKSYKSVDAVKLVMEQNSLQQELPELWRCIQQYFDTSKNEHVKNNSNYNIDFEDYNEYGQQQVLNSTSSGGSTSSFATGDSSLMGLGLNNGASNSQSSLNSNAQSNTNNNAQSNNASWWGTSNQNASKEEKRNPALEQKLNDLCQDMVLGKKPAAGLPACAVIMKELQPYCDTVKKVLDYINQYSENAQWSRIERLLKGCGDYQRLELIEQACERMCNVLDWLGADINGIRNPKEDTEPDSLFSIFKPLLDKYEKDTKVSEIIEEVNAMKQYKHKNSSCDLYHLICEELRRYEQDTVENMLKDWSNNATASIPLINNSNANSNNIPQSSHTLSQPLGSNYPDLEEESEEIKQKQDLDQLDDKSVGEVLNELFNDIQENGINTPFYIADRLKDCYGSKQAVSEIINDIQRIGRSQNKSYEVICEILRSWNNHTLDDIITDSMAPKVFCNDNASGLTCVMNDDGMHAQQNDLSNNSNNATASIPLINNSNTNSNSIPQGKHIDMEVLNELFNNIQDGPNKQVPIESESEKLWTAWEEWLQNDRKNFIDGVERRIEEKNVSKDVLARQLEETGAWERYPILHAFCAVSTTKWKWMSREKQLSSRTDDYNCSKKVLDEILDEYESIDEAITDWTNVYLSDTKLCPHVIKLMRELSEKSQESQNRLNQWNRRLDEADDRQKATIGDMIINHYGTVDCAMEVINMPENRKEYPHVFLWLHEESARLSVQPKEEREDIKFDDYIDNIQIVLKEENRDALKSVVEGMIGSQDPLLVIVKIMQQESYQNKKYVGVLNALVRYYAYFVKDTIDNKKGNLKGIKTHINQLIATAEKEKKKAHHEKDDQTAYQQDNNTQEEYNKNDILQDDDKKIAAIDQRLQLFKQYKFVIKQSEKILHNNGFHHNSNSFLSHDLYEKAEEEQNNNFVVMNNMNSNVSVNSADVQQSDKKAIDSREKNILQTIKNIVASNDHENQDYDQNVQALLKEYIQNSHIDGEQQQAQLCELKRFLTEFCAEKKQELAQAKKACGELKDKVEREQKESDKEKLLQVMKNDVRNRKQQLEAIKKWLQIIERPVCIIAVSSNTNNNNDMFDNTTYTFSGGSGIYGKSSNRNESYHHNVPSYDTIEQAVKKEFFQKLKEEHNATLESDLSDALEKAAQTKTHSALDQKWISSQKARLELERLRQAKEQHVQQQRNAGEEIDAERLSKWYAGVEKDLDFNNTTIEACELEMERLPIEYLIDEARVATIREECRQRVLQKMGIQTDVGVPNPQASSGDGSSDSEESGSSFLHNNVNNNFTHNNAYPAVTTPTIVNLGEWQTLDHKLQWFAVLKNRYLSTDNLEWLLAYQKDYLTDQDKQWIRLYEQYLNATSNELIVDKKQSPQRVQEKNKLEEEISALEQQFYELPLTLMGYPATIAILKGTFQNKLTEGTGSLNINLGEDYANNDQGHKKRVEEFHEMKQKYLKPKRLQELIEDYSEQLCKNDKDWIMAQQSLLTLKNNIKLIRQEAEIRENILKNKKANNDAYKVRVQQELNQLQACLVQANVQKLSLLLWIKGCEENMVQLPLHHIATSKIINEGLEEFKAMKQAWKNPLDGDVRNTVLIEKDADERDAGSKSLEDLLSQLSLKGKDGDTKDEKKVNNAHHDVTDSGDTSELIKVDFEEYTDKINALGNDNNELFLGRENLVKEMIGKRDVLAVILDFLQKNQYCKDKRYTGLFDALLEYYICSDKESSADKKKSLKGIKNFIRDKKDVEKELLKNYISIVDSKMNLIFNIVSDFEEESNNNNSNFNNNDSDAVALSEISADSWKTVEQKLAWFKELKGHYLLKDNLELINRYHKEDLTELEQQWVMLQLQYFDVLEDISNLENEKEQGAVTQRDRLQEFKKEKKDFEKDIESLEKTLDELPLILVAHPDSITSLKKSFRYDNAEDDSSEEVVKKQRKKLQKKDKSHQAKIARFYEMKKRLRFDQNAMIRIMSHSAGFSKLDDEDQEWIACQKNLIINNIMIQNLENQIQSSKISLANWSSAPQLEEDKQRFFATQNAVAQWQESLIWNKLQREDIKKKIRKLERSMPQLPLKHISLVFHFEQEAKTKLFEKIKEYVKKQMDFDNLSQRLTALNQDLKGQGKLTEEVKRWISLQIAWIELTKKKKQKDKDSLEKWISDLEEGMESLPLEYFIGAEILAELKAQCHQEMLEPQKKKIEEFRNIRQSQSERWRIVKVKNYYGACLNEIELSWIGVVDRLNAVNKEIQDIKAQTKGNKVKKKMQAKMADLEVEKKSLIQQIDAIEFYMEQSPLEHLSKVLATDLPLILNAIAIQQLFGLDKDSSFQNLDNAEKEKRILKEKRRWSLQNATDLHGNESNKLVQQTYDSIDQYIEYLHLEEKRNFAAMKEAYLNEDVLSQVEKNQEASSIEADWIEKLKRLYQMNKEMRRLGEKIRSVKNPEIPNEEMKEVQEKYLKLESDLADLQNEIRTLENCLKKFPSHYIVDKDKQEQSNAAFALGAAAGKTSNVIDQEKVKVILQFFAIDASKFFQMSIKNQRRCVDRAWKIFQLKNHPDKIQRDHFASATANDYRAMMNQFLDIGSIHHTTGVEGLPFLSNALHPSSLKAQEKKKTTPWRFPSIYEKVLYEFIDKLSSKQVTVSEKSIAAWKEYDQAWQESKQLKQDIHDLHAAYAKALVQNKSVKWLRMKCNESQAAAARLHELMRVLRPTIRTIQQDDEFQRYVDKYINQIMQQDNVPDEIRNATCDLLKKCRHFVSAKDRKTAKKEINCLSAVLEEAEKKYKKTLTIDQVVDELYPNTRRPTDITKFVAQNLKVMRKSANVYQQEVIDNFVSAVDLEDVSSEHDNLSNGLSYHEISNQHNKPQKPSDRDTAAQSWEYPELYTRRVYDFVQQFMQNPLDQPSIFPGLSEGLKNEWKNRYWSIWEQYQSELKNVFKSQESIQRYRQQLRPFIEQVQKEKKFQNYLETIIASRLQTELNTEAHRLELDILRACNKLADEENSAIKGDSCEKMRTEINVLLEKHVKALQNPQQGLKKSAEMVEITMPSNINFLSNSNDDEENDGEKNASGIINSIFGQGEKKLKKKKLFTEKQRELFKVIKKSQSTIFPGYFKGKNDEKSVDLVMRTQFQDMKSAYEGSKKLPCTEEAWKAILEYKRYLDNYDREIKQVEEDVRKVTQETLALKKQVEDALNGKKKNKPYTKKEKTPFIIKQEEKKTTTKMSLPRALEIFGLGTHEGNEEKCKVLIEAQKGAIQKKWNAQQSVKDGPQRAYKQAYDCIKAFTNDTIDWSQVVPDKEEEALINQDDYRKLSSYNSLGMNENYIQKAKKEYQDNFNIIFTEELHEESVPEAQLQKFQNISLNPEGTSASLIEDYNNSEEENKNANGPSSEQLRVERLQHTIKFFEDELRLAQIAVDDSAVENVTDDERTASANPDNYRTIKEIQRDIDKNQDKLKRVQAAIEQKKVTLKNNVKKPRASHKKRRTLRRKTRQGIGKIDYNRVQSIQARRQKRAAEQQRSKEAEDAMVQAAEQKRKRIADLPSHTSRDDEALLYSKNQDTGTAFKARERHLNNQNEQFERKLKDKQAMLQLKRQKKLAERLASVEEALSQLSQDKQRLSTNVSEKERAEIALKEKWLKTSQSLLKEKQEKARMKVLQVSKSLDSNAYNTANLVGVQQSIDRANQKLTNLEKQMMRKSVNQLFASVYSKPISKVEKKETPEESDKKLEEFLAQLKGADQSNQREIEDEDAHLRSTLGHLANISTASDFTLNLGEESENPQQQPLFDINKEKETSIALNSSLNSNIQVVRELQQQGTKKKPKPIADLLKKQREAKKNNKQSNESNLIFLSIPPKSPIQNNDDNKGEPPHIQEMTAINCEGVSTDDVPEDTTECARIPAALAPSANENERLINNVLSALNYFGYPYEDNKDNLENLTAHINKCYEKILDNSEKNCAHDNAESLEIIKEYLEKYDDNRKEKKADKQPLCESDHLPEGNNNVSPLSIPKIEFTQQIENKPEEKSKVESREAKRRMRNLSEIQAFLINLPYLLDNENFVNQMPLNGPIKKEAYTAYNIPPAATIGDTLLDIVLQHGTEEDVKILLKKDVQLTEAHIERANKAWQTDLGAIITKKGTRNERVSNTIEPLCRGLAVRQWIIDRQRLDMQFIEKIAKFYRKNRVKVIEAVLKSNPKDSKEAQKEQYVAELSTLMKYKIIAPDQTFGDLKNLSSNETVLLNVSLKQKLLDFVLQNGSSENIKMVLDTGVNPTSHQLQMAVLQLQTSAAKLRQLQTLAAKKKLKEDLHARYRVLEACVLQSNDLTLRQKFVSAAKALGVEGSKLFTAEQNTISIEDSSSSVALPKFVIDTKSQEILSKYATTIHGSLNDLEVAARRMQKSVDVYFDELLHNTFNDAIKEIKQQREANKISVIHEPIYYRYFLSQVLTIDQEISLFAEISKKTCAKETRQGYETRTKILSVLKSHMQQYNLDINKIWKHATKASKQKKSSCDTLIGKVCEEVQSSKASKASVQPARVHQPEEAQVTNNKQKMYPFTKDHVTSVYDGVRNMSAEVMEFMEQSPEQYCVTLILTNLKSALEACGSTESPEYWFTDFVSQPIKQGSDKTLAAYIKSQINKVKAKEQSETLEDAIKQNHYFTIIELLNLNTPYEKKSMQALQQAVLLGKSQAVELIFAASKIKLLPVEKTRLIKILNKDGLNSNEEKNNIEKMINDHTDTNNGSISKTALAQKAASYTAISKEKVKKIEKEGKIDLAKSMFFTHGVDKDTQEIWDAQQSGDKKPKKRTNSTSFSEFSKYAEGSHTESMKSSKTDTCTVS